MKAITMTHALAMAAAQDAGNRSMREGRRTVGMSISFDESLLEVR